jgi:hypothetical protein
MEIIIQPTAETEAGVVTVLIRSSGLAPGKILLRATTPGLKSAQAELDSMPAGNF